MKKILFSFVIIWGSFIYAQADLYNTNWYLKKVVKNNINYNLPQNSEIGSPILTFTSTSNPGALSTTNLNSSICGQSISALLYNIDMTTTTLNFWTYVVGIGNTCTTPENITFSPLYTGYFGQNFPVHSYQITYTGNTKTLILTNGLGDQTFYQSGNLNTNDISHNLAEKITIIYPNPATDYLVIESKHPIEWTKVYNSEGRLILQNKYETKLDISALSKGGYFLEVKSQNGTSKHKFIKE
ncbi:T9SS type A sorting domain-containing protein [Chryseobacterium sp. RG1]|uniref:T9SS type A sorting domain-containing protein n=1 Tax=Chryseobacterium tagetis TaxID=2801334 RepID=A0ABS7ZWZ4_9FLAO|nr:T9SS type A sorting domain-containing protein [Chryseobacterium tagetis]MCA6066117.1 T9SS type A sorting domain-containing protein [Chryseobacterium tagetis]